MSLRVLESFAAALLLLAAPTAAAPGSAERIRADVDFLASDLLEGRAAATRGHDIAAAFVATRLRAAGLEPVGEGSDLVQTVPLRRATLVAGSTRAEIGERGRWQSLGAEAIRVAPALAQRHLDLSAGLVFAGYGIDEPGMGQSDYAAIDARGKIVVVLAGAPPGLGAEVAAFVKSQKASAAAARGAVGLIELPPGPYAASDLGPDPGTPTHGWATARDVGPDPALARVTISSRLAERLFAGASRPLAAVQREALGGRRPTGFALAASLRLTADSEWRDTPSPQVVARLRGSDPRLAAQSIVLVAHLDHLGRIAADARGDTIANGALDNAAGVAVLLDVARSLAAAPTAPRRSVVVLVTTGEELGAIGADFAASHWPGRAGRPVAALAIDMPLLLHRLADIAAPGAGQSAIGAALAGAGRPLGIALSPDPMPNQELIVRSDQLRFLERGVPAALLVTGHGGGGKAEWDDFLSRHYHRPSDDLEQPIRWEEGARLATLVADAVRRLADQPSTPSWNADSFFARRTPHRSIGEDENGR